VAGRLRHLLEHLGPGMQRRWKALGQPELTPETVGFLSAETEKRFAGHSYAELTEQRDRAQLGVLAGREVPQQQHASPATPLTPLLGDFYGYEDLLSPADQGVVLRTGSSSSGRSGPSPTSSGRHRSSRTS